MIYKLGDLGELKNGANYPKNSYGVGYKIVNVKDLFKSHFIDYDLLDELKPDVLSNPEQYRIENGDLLFTRSSLVQSGTGMVAMANKPEGLIIYCGFIIRFRPYKELVNPIFLTYLLRSQKYRDMFINLASQTTITNINQKTLSAIEVDIPNLLVQDAISDTLLCLDDKIELNNRINKNLEEMAQAIFKSWFIDFEPFQDGEFEESELGRIPKGWRAGTIADLGEIVGGSTPSKACPNYYTNNGIAWITPKDLSINKDKFISRGEIDITELGLKNSSTKIMPKGTVLFSSRAPIGYIAIAKNDATTNQGFKSVVPKKNVGSAFVYYYLKNNIDIIESRATGSTFKEVSGSIMKMIPALIPDENTLIKFENLCSGIFDTQMMQENQNKLLTAIRDTLIPKLMSGEIRVPVEEVQ